MRKEITEKEKNKTFCQESFTYVHDIRVSKKQSKKKVSIKKKIFNFMKQNSKILPHPSPPEKKKKKKK